MRKILFKYLNIIYIFILSFVFLGSLIFIYLNLDFIMKHWFTSLTTFVAFIGCIVTAKDISHRIKSFLIKTKVILFNRQTAWSLEADFTSDKITQSTFNEIKIFLQSLGNKRIIFSESDYKISLNIDGVTLQLSYKEDDNNDIFISNDTNGIISVYLPEYHAPYLESNILLENRIMPVLNEIKNKIGFAQETFRFEVIFKDKNPFLGLYIKDIPNNKLSFLCDFKENTTVQGIEEDNRIAISHNAMNIKSTNLYSLTRLINKHLFLAGGY